MCLSHEILIFLAKNMSNKAVLHKARLSNQSTTVLVIGQNNELCGIAFFDVF